MKPSKKKLLFKTIAILLPVFFLLLLEGSLRLFHYGHDLSLFAEYPGDHRYLTLNPDASKKYFTEQAIAPTGNREPFKKVKDSNTCRIFVLGESTTIGYPYFHNGSFHRWLQYRLRQSFPGRSYEIINLSLTGVNSYTVLGFAKELVDYEPDAVLIYSGQNEYYGALGVGSTNKIAGNSALIQCTLRLRSLRITQLLGNLYDKISGAFKASKTYSGETLMRRMAADQHIPYGSKTYQRGIDQFRTNMEKTLELFHEHHVPVFISNLVSNERDLKPFVSIDPEPGQAPGFKENYEKGLTALERQDTAAAEGFFKKANQGYSLHALCNYYLGELAYGRGAIKEAADWYSKARDLDGLRFRAPSALNTIISQLCVKIPNTYLVDTKTRFESQATDHLIGKELILEHVHPNLWGYALLSDVFYEAMKKQPFIPDDPKKEMSFRELVATMPLTLVDSLSGAYRIAKLKRTWPFNEAKEQDSIKPVSEEEKIAYGVAFENLRWPEAMETLYDYYISRNDLPKAGTVMESMTLEFPEQASYYERAANVYGKLNDLKKSVFYFEKAFALAPSFNLARAVFVIYLELDKPVDALPAMEYALANSSDRRLALIRQTTQEIIQLQQGLLKDPSNVQLLTGIAGKYAGMGNKPGASKYIQKALSVEPGNKNALSMLARLNLPSR